MNDTNGIPMSQITITRTYNPENDGDGADAITVDTTGNMPLIEKLGLIEFARMSIIEDMLRGPEGEGE